MLISVTKPKVVKLAPSEVTVWKAVFDWVHCGGGGVSLSVLSVLSVSVFAFF